MPLVLSPRSRRAFDRMATDLERVFGARFVALVAYAERASVAFAATVGVDDLEALAPLVEHWHRDGAPTPLVMTPEEFARSLDVFPLESQAILQRHVLVAGRDPLAGLTVAPEDVRRACEVHAKGHLLHLRQGWIDAAGHADRLADLAVRSAGPFRALTASLARLSGAGADSDEQLAAFIATTTAAPADLAREVLSLEGSPDAARNVAARMGAYLALSERLWQFVDTWAPR
jgi:hypothetical protein